MNEPFPSDETCPCISHLRVSPAKQETQSPSERPRLVSPAKQETKERGPEDRTSLPKAGVEPKAKRLNPSRFRSSLLRRIGAGHQRRAKRLLSGAFCVNGVSPVACQGFGPDFLRNPFIPNGGRSRNPGGIFLFTR